MVPFDSFCCGEFGLPLRGRSVCFSEELPVGWFAAVLGRLGVAVSEISVGAEGAGFGFHVILLSGLATRRITHYTARLTS